jgi:outer membrane protein OmpA-like peptidoglycan-associated protein
MSTTLSRLAAAGAAALGLLTAAPALAQEPIPEPYPIDIERFRPPADTYGYAVTHSSTTLKNLQVGVGFWGNYAEDSAVLIDLEGNRLVGPGPKFPDGMIDQRSIVDFQLGMGLGNIFSLTVDGPVVVWQSGFEPAAANSPVPVADPVSAALADLRITPKFVLVDIHEGYPVGLALLAEATVPVGTTRSLIGEGDPTVTPLVAFEAADGSVHAREYLVRAALNVGGRLKSPDRFRDLSLGSEFVYRVAIGARPADALEIGADLNGSVGGTRVAQAPLEVLPWLKLIGFDVATLTAGGGVGLNPGLGAPDLRLFGGVTLGPSFDPLSLDRDNDGIPNKFDLCINIPEDHDGFEDEDGCPDEDNDQDGILDVNDSCPNDPEDKDGFEDADGCPDVDNDKDGVLDVTDQCPMVPEDIDDWEDQDGCPDPDNDGDGIPDTADACPNAAETVNGFQDQDGCPDDKPFVDTDGDGYEDERDGCPFDPEDFDGFQDEDGCPDTDNDQDGIFDVDDDCPMDPETINQYLDEDGCPDTAPSRVVVKKNKIEITEKIFFEYNKAEIKALSFELLEVAGVMNDYPTVTLIQIEGHTDSDGSEGYNLKLSQRRADAVMEYLTNAGVDASRLVAKGFGESLPIDTNETTEGKARNRRVEFTILERE